MRDWRLGMSILLVAIFHGAAATQAGHSDGSGPRTDHAVGFYDPQLRRVVLVGGAGDPKAGDRDRVWTWNGDRWDLLTGAGPASRVNAAAAYEAGRARALVVGGSRQTDGANWEVVGDSWEGDAQGWRPFGSIPPRDHHSLVEDGGGILMFGGIPADRSAAWPSETWRLVDGRWRRVATAGPAGRARTALAYDTKRRQVILFGGVGAPQASNQSQTFFADTWVWNGEAWLKAAEESPPGRYAHGMVFDERAGVVLLYGGAAAHRDAPLSDMWEWDGARWTQIRPAGPTPGHRYQPVMVYDRLRERTLLYGGIGNPSDTWEWDGQRWRQIAD